MKKEKISEDTLCPHCLYELDDDDGCFFDEYSGTKNCINCGNRITYVKQFKEEISNPFCDFVWDKTYLEWTEL